MSTAPETPSDQLTIIVADDDPNERLLLATAAREGDVEPDLHFAVDGRGVLELLDPERGIDPDLIVLDLRMPVMDGHETLMRLAERPDTHRVPVVVWTTSTEPTDPGQCWSEGAWWFENKPESFAGYIEFMRSIPARCEEARAAIEFEPDWDVLLADLPSLN